MNIIEFIASIVKPTKIVYANSGSIYFKKRIDGRRGKVRLSNHNQMRYYASDPVWVDIRWTDSQEIILNKLSIFLK